MADDQNPELPLTPPPDGGGPGALNNVRDGLKPVHRRILYTMQHMGLAPNRPTRKCARIVGEVMGKYHPHGKLAVYDALVRLPRPGRMRYPLVTVRATSDPWME